MQGCSSITFKFNTCITKGRTLDVSYLVYRYLMMFPSFLCPLSMISFKWFSNCLEKNTFFFVIWISHLLWLVRPTSIRPTRINSSWKVSANAHVRKRSESKSKLFHRVDCYKGGGRWKNGFCWAFKFKNNYTVFHKEKSWSCLLLKNSLLVS